IGVSPTGNGAAQSPQCARSGRMPTAKRSKGYILDFMGLVFCVFVAVGRQAAPAAERLLAEPRGVASSGMRRGRHRPVGSSTVRQRIIHNFASEALGSSNTPTTVSATKASGA